MNLLDFLNRQTQFTDLGYFIVSKSKLDNVDGLIPDAMRFVKCIKSSTYDGVWSTPLTLADLDLQSRMHRIITEYQILYDHYNKMIGEESFTFDEIEDQEQEIQSLYDDFIRPLLEEICPDGCWFGANPDQLNERGYWRSADATKILRDENPVEDQIGDKGSDVDLSISPFNSDNPPDCKCEGVPDDHVLITDPQEIKSIFESIGQPDLYEYFHGLFVKMAEESSLAVYESIYGFIGIVPNNWKPCWRIL
jgi:hypothetical protein